MVNHCWAFIYPESNSLPVIIWCGKQYLNRSQFVRGFHFANIKIGNLFAYTDFFCPYIVMLSLIFKYSCIQGKCFKRKFVLIGTSHFALLCPGSCNRICIGTFQHIWTDCPDIVLISTGKINVPFTIQIMEFRCPDMFAHNSFFMFLPDCYFFRVFQSCQSFASSQYDTVISRYGCCKIIISICMAVYIWVCSL